MLICLITRIAWWSIKRCCYFIKKVSATTYERPAPTGNMFTNTMVKSIVSAAFYDAHDFTPRDWQISSASYLLECCRNPSRYKPQPILLVHTTSGGKSAVRDVVGYSTSGVVITIVPLLSLAADQVNKLKLLESNNPTVSAYNIDAICDGEAKRHLQVALSALPKDTNKTVFLERENLVLQTICLKEWLQFCWFSSWSGAIIIVFVLFLCCSSMSSGSGCRSSWPQFNIAILLFLLFCAVTLCFLSWLVLFLSFQDSIEFFFLYILWFLQSW